MAAQDDIEPLIVFTKGDLVPEGSAEELVDRYRDLDYTVLVSGHGEQFAATHQQIRDHLAQKAAFLLAKVASAKVRWSIYWHRISPLASAIFLRPPTKANTPRQPLDPTFLPNNTRLIDTPGIRELALLEIEPLTAALLYRDIARFHHDCKFNDCTHRHEPDCAVIAAVERGDIHPARYESYLRLCDGTDELGPDTG